MNSSTWAALEPHLRPFLKRDSESGPQERCAAADGRESLSPTVLESMIRMIMACPDLSEAERIKFIRVLLRGSEESCGSRGDGR